MWRAIIKPRAAGEEGSPREKAERESRVSSGEAEEGTGDRHRAVGFSPMDRDAGLGGCVFHPLAEDVHAAEGALQDLQAEDEGWRVAVPHGPLPRHRPNPRAAVLQL